MSGIDYFAWVVLIVIIISVVGCFIALAKLPGDMARAKGHPQADAINIAGWLGLLLTMGVVWVLALVWANLRPVSESAAADKLADDQTEIAALKARIAELEAAAAGSAGGAGE